MLGVDERRLAAELLRLGDDLKSQRGFAARFRPVNFDHAAAWKPSHAQRQIDGYRSRGDHADRHEHVFAAQAHDRAFAVLFLDLGNCRLEHLGLFVGHRWRSCVLLR